MDRTAEALALFSAMVKDEHGGPKCKRSIRPSQIMATTMAMKNWFNRLNAASRTTSIGGAVSHPFAAKACVSAKVPEKIPQTLG